MYSWHHYNRIGRWSRENRTKFSFERKVVFYIDDDEWIIDPEPLYEFFEKGRSDNVHWADVILRDFWGAAKDVTLDGWVSRLVRMEDDTRFVGLVHEMFVPLIGEPVGINIVIGHRR